jgi:hypothetical protein
MYLRKLPACWVSSKPPTTDQVGFRRQQDRQHMQMRLANALAATTMKTTKTPTRNATMLGTSGVAAHGCRLSPFPSTG